MTLAPDDLRRYIHGLCGEHEAQVRALERFAAAWESYTSADLSAEFQRGAEAMRAAAIAAIDEQITVFLSPQYATDQPHSSFAERLGCNMCRCAIEELHLPTPAPTAKA